MGKRRNTQPYLTSDEIYEEWSKWKQTGVISEAFGKQMLLLATHVMDMPAFMGYSQFEKEEMIQEGVLKIMKNLKNMKEEKRKGFFSYWTCCVYSSNITYLRNHYKRMNERRKMLLAALKSVMNSNQNCPKNQLLKCLQQTIALYNKEENN